MSDAKDDKTTEGQAPASPTTPTTGPRAPLSLKPRQAGAVSAGVVRQSFSHGRSKTVVVETKRRRADGAPGAAEKRQPAFDVARPRPAAAPPRAAGPRD